MYQLECDLVNDLVAGLTKVLQPSDPSFLTTELTLRRRVVDVAFAEAVDPRTSVQDWSEYAPGFRRLSSSHTTLLAIIWREKRISLDRLARSTWSDASELQRNYLDGMAKAHLIEVNRRGTVSPTSWADWNPGTLVAVEAKLSDWRNAVSQAVDHTEWADYSFVAMPAAGPLSRREVRQAIRENGIGGLAVDPDAGVTVAVHARRSSRATSGRARVALGLLRDLSSARDPKSWRISEAS